jgi:catechol 2,3-dioxygenase-like lactoylglutathione lyase family enzyme
MNCFRSFTYCWSIFCINIQGRRKMTVQETVAEKSATLGNRDAVATIAVKDLKIARKFYEDTLGLKPSGEANPEVVSYKSGNSAVLVYRSQFAGTNRATAVTWIVGENIEQIVQTLRAKGVRFEHYDFPQMTRQGDIHIAGKMKNAWFKDPDGNILSIVNG